MLENQFIKFYFELQDKSELCLTYNLFPTSFKERWIEHVTARCSEAEHSLNLKISNKNAHDIPYLIAKLNLIIESINQYYDIPLPLFTDTTSVDHEILNYLHEQFEIYGERHHQIIETEKQHLKNPGDPNVWPGHRFRQDFHESWMDLNEYIHITEDALENSIEKFPNYSCLVHAYPPVLGEPVQEIDKLFLTTDFRWGHLYLGYNTLGKDYMHAGQHDDGRVILNDQVKVQEFFSSEVWFNFNESSVLSKIVESLWYTWYKNQTAEIKAKTPTDNLNKLALGRYVMGNIVIDDTFLKINPDLNRWLYDHALQKQWNLEVFSKIERALRIEIVK